MKYTALETSNKINVVSGDSIRKTHRTISHTILRQNDHDSYLLHGRHSPFPSPSPPSPPPSPSRRPFTSSPVSPSLNFSPLHPPPSYLILFIYFFFLQNNSISLVDLAGTKNEISTKDGFHGNYPWRMTEPRLVSPRNDLCVAREWQSEAESKRARASECLASPGWLIFSFFFFFFFLRRLMLKLGEKAHS